MESNGPARIPTFRATPQNQRPGVSRSGRPAPRLTSQNLPWQRRSDPRKPFLTVRLAPVVGGWTAACNGEESAWHGGFTTSAPSAELRQPPKAATRPLETLQADARLLKRRDWDINPIWASFFAPAPVAVDA